MTDQYLRPQVIRPSRITIPKRCHPLVKLIFAEMARQNITYFELEMLSGVLTSSLKSWRTTSTPTLTCAEAALGTLGYTLMAVPKIEMLPEELREQVERIGGALTSGQVIGAAIQAAAEWPPFAAAHLQAGVRTPAREIAA